MRTCGCVRRNTGRWRKALLARWRWNRWSRTEHSQAATKGIEPLRLQASTSETESNRLVSVHCPSSTWPEGLCRHPAGELPLPGLALRSGAANASNPGVRRSFAGPDRRQLPRAGCRDMTSPRACITVSPSLVVYSIELVTRLEWVAGLRSSQFAHS